MFVQMTKSVLWLLRFSAYPNFVGLHVYTGQLLKIVYSCIIDI